MQGDKKKKLIVELTFGFALKIIKHTGLLEKDRKFVLATQLFKSGTCVRANVRKAQNAGSKPEFIHKMKIATKEADETEYCLLLCDKEGGCTDCKELLNDCSSITKVLSKIIASSKKRLIN